MAKVKYYYAQSVRFVKIMFAVCTRYKIIFYPRDNAFIYKRSIPVQIFSYIYSYRHYNNIIIQIFMHVKRY